MGTLRDKIGQTINDQLFELDDIKCYYDSREIDRIADAVMVVCCFPPDTPDDAFTKPLRDLRMWHWREAMNARRLEREHEGRLQVVLLVNGFSEDGYTARKCRRSVNRFSKIADRHIKAVQALNLVVSGTAEEDCKS